jgi:hypothetical protein
MTKPLNINPVTPVSLCLKEICNRALHIKFKKQALIYYANSAIDSVSGATGSQEAVAQQFGFDTSKSSHHGLIRLRDKSTRILSETATVQEAGDKPPYEAFDWRTIIAFRFPMDLNVEEVKAYVPGLGWVNVDLRNRRFWASAPQDEERIAEFNSLQRRLAQVSYEREQVKKARDNGKKQPFMKDVAKIAGKWNDREFVYEQTSGETDKLFEKATGEEVKKVRSLQPKKDVALVAQFDLDKVSIPKAQSPEDVANLAARFEILGETEKHLCKAIREIELGLIEDYMIGLNTDSLDDIDGKTITYGDVSYTITFSDSNSYDLPNGTDKRWKNGELEMRKAETRSQWRAKEVNAVNVTEEEFAEV